MKFIYNILITLFMLITLFYIINYDFKLLVNTNYNKYSNILETNINNLHNKLLKKNSIIIDDLNSDINSNTYLVLLITLFTGILLFFLNFYYKSIINSDNIILYTLLIDITFITYFTI